MEEFKYTHIFAWMHLHFLLFLLCPSYSAGYALGLVIVFSPLVTWRAMVFDRSFFIDYSSFSLWWWSVYLCPLVWQLLLLLMMLFLAAPPWSCDEVLTAGPSGSQTEAFDTIKKYAISQGFAVASSAAILLGLSALVSDVPKEMRGF